MDAKKFLLDLLAKLRALVLSRKFWVLVGALAVIGEQSSTGAITEWQAVQAAIAAVAVYMTTVAYEDGQHARAGGRDSGQ